MSATWVLWYVLRANTPLHEHSDAYLSLLLLLVSVWRRTVHCAHAVRKLGYFGAPPQKKWLR